MVNIYELLQECKVEKDVEEKFKRVIGEYFPKSKISSPYRTDGLLEDEDLKLLMEYKFDCDFTKRLQVVNLLIQIIYYLKQFENHGDEIPTVLLGGDKDECFCLHSNDVIKYLDEDIDWTITPSDAPSKNPELAKKIAADQTINPYVFNINNSGFNFKHVVDKIKQLNLGIVQKVRITEFNINRYFDYFIDRIIKLNMKKFTWDDAVSIFLGCIIDSVNNYPHPNKKNCLVTSTFGEFKINLDIYNSFFDHFATNYSVDEKKRLTAICDRLIEDLTRRTGGEFYTPTEWVNEAHKMIEEQFGVNWKKEYVVWDPSWGTGNLTRDYQFKELYCSTINHGDLSTGKNYNPEAVKFQYDFLNDDVTSEGTLSIPEVNKLPDGLSYALNNNKPIIILMNPPYGSCGDLRKVNKRQKEGIAINLINELMKKYKLNRAATQLFSQFLYRIILFNSSNISICSFVPSNLFSTDSYKNFRSILFSKFDFIKGFLFNAGVFSNVKSSWAVSFNILKPGTYNHNTFNFDIKEIDDDLKIKNTTTKGLYNSDDNNDNKSSIWIREEIKNKKFIDSLQLKNAINVSNRKRGKMLPNAIGFFYNSGNVVYESTTRVSLFSTTNSIEYNGFPVISENFDKVVSLFTARKSTICNWINCNDSYLKPNEQHNEYKQWNIDAIIYSLFNSSSQQSSLRKIDYKNRKCDIKNEWFWMSNEQMQILASSSENGFDELYHDAQDDHDRFVYNKIQEIYVDPNQEFSADAEAVLSKARELVIESFKFRSMVHEEYPEYHLNAWDAGWYQIKKILNLYFKDELKEFNILYKTFKDRMRKGVYKFGFLK